MKSHRLLGRIKPKRSELDRSVSLFLLCAGLLEGAFLQCEGKQPRATNQLQHLYIVSQVFSDASPHWFDYILDIKPYGGDVVVRYIRIAPENPYCDGFVTVKAIETRLANTSVSKLAGRFGLCSIREADVDQAIADAAPKGLASIFDTARFGIVAQCGKSERVFHLPYPETVEMTTLKAKTPAVAALYDMEWKLHRRVFGKRRIFHGIAPTEDLELQRLGASLLPELRTGLYDRGMADRKDAERCPDTFSCNLGLTADLLEGYWGPDRKPHEPTTTLLNSQKYLLTKYIPPEYPPLAKMARIEGKVEIQIRVDSATGAVKQAQAVSGHKLLQKAAEQAVAGWKFQPSDAGFAQPISAVLDFSLGCSDVRPD